MLTSKSNFRCFTLWELQRSKMFKKRELRKISARKERGWRNMHNEKLND